MIIGFGIFSLRVGAKYKLLPFTNATLCAFSISVVSSFILTSIPYFFVFCFQGLLSLTAGWRRTGALVSRRQNFDSRLA